MSTLEGTPSTDTLYRHVHEILLACSESDFKRCVVDVFEELDKSVRQSCEVDTVDDLERRLRSRPQLFHFSSEDVNDLPTVALTTTLNWCEAHCARGGSCRDRACAGLHFCLFSLLSGNCRHGTRCHFGHNLGSEHNVRVLRRHGLDRLGVGELGSLLALPWVRRGVACPQVCRHYNTNKGCTKEGECRYLHLCKFYVSGDCKFEPKCKRNHELADDQVRQVLELYGVEREGRQDADILKEVAIYDSTPRDKPNGPAVASSLWHMGGSPGIHQGSTIGGWPLFGGRTEDQERLDHHGPASSPPRTRSGRTSSQSDCLEDGEIREDLRETSSLSEDDIDSTGPDMTSLPKDGRGRGKSLESSWRMDDVTGCDTSRMSEYGEERDRRGEPRWISKRSGNETWYGSSRVSYDDNLELPRWPQDNGRMRASRQISGDSRRRDVSPVRIPLSPQRPEDDWEWNDSSPRSARRHHSPRRSQERQEEYNSLQWSDDGGRKYSPGIPARRYGSPDTSKDVRGSYDSPPMSDRRRRDSSQMSSTRRCNSPQTSSRRRQESRQTHNREYFSSQRANHHRTRGYSAQVPGKRPYASPPTPGNYMRHSEETRFDSQAPRWSGANGILEDAHRRTRRDNSPNSSSDSSSIDRPLMTTSRADRRLRHVSPPHRASFLAENEETDSLHPFTGFREHIDFGRRSPGGKMRGRRIHPGKSGRPYQHPGSRRQRQFVKQGRSFSSRRGNERQRKR